MRMDSSRIHEQKRLLLSNLKELYRYFGEKHPDLYIGFSSFASLRPKHCIFADQSGAHTVCVCSLHQNMKLMILGCDLPKLTKDSEYPIMTFDDVLMALVCDNPQPSCYLGYCDTCPGKEALDETLLKIFREKGVTNISYKHWVSKPRTILESIENQPIGEFMAAFRDQAAILLKHAFIAKQQSRFFKTSKANLSEGECIVQVDFAENYAFIVQDAAPGFHWNNSQATIYTVVVYYNNGNDVQYKSLVIISNCMQHDAVAVFMYSRIINEFVKTLVEKLKKILYFSDGAPQQYKNFKSFTNVYWHEKDFGIPAEWHFFATAHGKGPCDGLGGTIKRLAAKASLQRSSQEQITTPLELYRWAIGSESISAISVKYADVKLDDEAKEFLANRFQSARSVKRPQALHCLIPGENGNAKIRIYSDAEITEVHRLIE